MNRFDVAVVGAGPAGTSAAITAAQQGLHVALIERSEFPRNKVGETLHPGVEALLRKLGVWDTVCQQNFVLHDSVALTYQGNTTVTAYGSDSRGPWLGIHAWRATFDNLLLKKCHEMGVCIWQPCRVLSAITSNGAVVGLETNRGKILARTIIDASGSRQWLAGQLELALQIESPRLIAQFGYMKGELSPTFDVPHFFADSGGWSWIARVRPQTYQWTSLTRWECRQKYKNNSKNTFPGERFGLPSQNAKSDVRASELTWRYLKTSAGKGYFICGDAASILDPAASRGVLKALLSGIYAGTLAGQIAHNIQNVDVCAAEYSHWLCTMFNQDIFELKRRYSSLGLESLYKR